MITLLNKAAPVVLSWRRGGGGERGGTGECGGTPKNAVPSGILIVKDIFNMILQKDNQS